MYFRPVLCATFLSFISTIVAVPDHENSSQHSNPPYQASRPTHPYPTSYPPSPPSEPVPPGTPSLREEDIVPSLKAETKLQVRGNSTVTGRLKAYSKNVKFCDGEIKPNGKDADIQCHPGYNLHYNWTGTEGNNPNKKSSPQILGYRLSHWDLTPNGTRNENTWMRVNEGWLCAKCHSDEGGDFGKCTLLEKNCGKSETAGRK
ncbi:hypothetical protein BJ875DRAFT_530182 [Amylocarpus encephaloides]|uniref:Cyanovirin-N domain-containing protein n=1 Tax=Amylocarpus encephaloides TaxID=45428 RepID=A0A9P7YJT5_9HELO|nr:hypothetical protein BJ875DRAFT_530182 [Amylocarpus encephaloides]